MYCRFVLSWTIGFLLLVHHYVETVDDRLYTFAFSNDGFPNDFMQDGEVTGQSVDLVKAVCKFAGKKCAVSMAQRQHCWDTTLGFPSFSLSLNNKWFDSCANYPPNEERRMSYSFGDENFFNTPVPILVTSAKSKVTLEELKTCNDRKLVYAANLGLTPNCFLETGYFVKRENRIPVPFFANNTLFEIMARLEEMTVNKEADLALIVPRFASFNGTKTLTDLPCGKALPTGLNNMMRQDNTELQKWWSDALNKFMCVGSKYKNFCNVLKENYGEDPLCRTPGKDLDCSKYGGPKLQEEETSSRRIFPCDEQCSGLKKGVSNYIFKDNNGADMTDALGGSGAIYEGPPKENVLLTITGRQGQRFWVDNICLTIKNIKEIKFVFRGGQRKATEVNIPVKDELNWTTHCIQHTEKRNIIRVKLRIRNVKGAENTIMLKGVEMKACISNIN